MEEVLVFQHDPFEDLGFSAEVLEKHGTNYRVLRLFHGEMPGEDWQHVGALIILGGPMSVDEEESFPFLRWEKRIIRAAIDEAVPMLGICLGAQLIAATLGTPIFHGSVKEIGWSPISITPHGQVDSLLGYLPENATVFQWHGDGFDLPAGAIRLASSIHFKTQAFRLGKAIYGLQFHLEVTEVMAEEWGAVPAGVKFDESLYGKLKAWVEKHYRDRLLPKDLADPELLKESRAASAGIYRILGLSI